MKILIDTNIFLDFLQAREPYHQSAAELIQRCGKREFEGYIAAHSIPNLFYILRKQFDIPKRKKLLRSLCEIFNVVEIDKANICAALDNDNWKDFEDCLQYQCACSADVDYIITRNPKDYVGSEISLLTAEEFLDLAK